MLFFNILYTNFNKEIETIKEMEYKFLKLNNGSNATTRIHIERYAHS